MLTPVTGAWFRPLLRPQEADLKVLYGCMDRQNTLLYVYKNSIS